jgi:hypothetical protein
MSLRFNWSGPPPRADVLHDAFVVNNALGSPACFQGHRRLPVGNRSPPKRLAKASAFPALEKQNTTKSLSSRRREFASGVADRIPAAQNITSRLTRPYTFSARSATRCGHVRLRSPRVTCLYGGSSPRHRHQLRCWLVELFRPLRDGLALVGGLHGAQLQAHKSRFSNSNGKVDVPEGRLRWFGFTCHADRITVRTRAIRTLGPKVLRSALAPGIVPRNAGCSGGVPGPEGRSRFPSSAATVCATPSFSAPDADSKLAIRPLIAVMMLYCDPLAFTLTAGSLARRSTARRRAIDHSSGSEGGSAFRAGAYPLAATLDSMWAGSRPER